MTAAEREVRPEPEPELGTTGTSASAPRFFGESRFESRRAYASSTDGDSDDDHYAFESETTDPVDANPGLNTPNDGLSEREPSERAYSVGESYDAEESASDDDDQSGFAQTSFSPESYRFNASGEEATRAHYARQSDYLHDFRDADDVA